MPILPIACSAQALLDLRSSFTTRTASSWEVSTLWSSRRKHWSSPNRMCIFKAILVLYLETGRSPLSSSTTIWHFIRWLVGKSKCNNFWFNTKRLQLPNSFGSMDKGVWLCVVLRVPYPLFFLNIVKRSSPTILEKKYSYTLFLWHKKQERSNPYI